MVTERTIRAVCERLGIHVRIQRCTDVLPRQKLRDLEANARLIAPRNWATRYLSGPAARAYLSIDRFHAEGLEVAWMDYDGYPPYPGFRVSSFHASPSWILIAQCRLRGAALPGEAMR